MKGLVTIMLFSFLGVITQAQDYSSQFNTSMEAKDTLNQRVILEQWENSYPEDPELAVAYFNYHFAKGMQERILLSPEPPKDGEVLALTDSLGNEAGFLSSYSDFNLEEIQKGIKRIDKAIKSHPDRLDMRFGKAYVLGEIIDQEGLQEVFVEIIQRSAVNKNQWLWNKGENLPDGQMFMLQTIQSYIGEAFDRMEDRDLKLIETVSSEIVKYYPDNVEAHNNMSALYLIYGEFEKALETLLRIEKSAPEDVIVLGNIGFAYANLGDNEKAIEYFQKVVDSGTEEEKEWAEWNISQLVEAP